MKELKLSDLNQALVKTVNPDRLQGMLDLANLINAMYPNATHSHLIGDYALAKLNLLRKGKKIRKAVRV